MNRNKTQKKSKVPKLLVPKLELQNQLNKKKLKQNLKTQDIKTNLSIITDSKKQFMTNNEIHDIYAKGISPPTPPYNKAIINILDQLNKYTTKLKQPFRARAYSKAKSEIEKLKTDITNLDEIKTLPNIGTGILEKLTEFITTGSLTLNEGTLTHNFTYQTQIPGELQDQAKDNPHDILTKIYGVGPKKAD